MNVLLLLFIIGTLNSSNVLALFEHTNLTDAIDYLDLNINESLSYESPADFTPYIETSTNETYGKYHTICFAFIVLHSPILFHYYCFPNFLLLLFSISFTDSLCLWLLANTYSYTPLRPSSPLFFPAIQSIMSRDLWIE